MLKKVMIFCLVLISVKTNAQKLPFKFDAKALLTLSDADMVASAYGDGKLQTEKGVEDAFTVIKIGQNIADFQSKSLEVPNSVTNWVNGLAISTDNKTAFVVDTRGGLPRKVQQVKNVFEELPPGKTLYAIDISDLSKPKVIAKTQVGATPLSVDVNRLYGSLLICGSEKGKEIIVVEWQNGKFGKQTTFAQAGKVTHANWHPSGKYFGVTLENTKQIQFFSFEKGTVAQLGDPVSISGFPGAALWSPNGKFYIVPNLNWDKGYDKKGELIAIAFDEKGKHSITQKTEVGISPEGICISPNGHFIASSNMGTNFIPIELPVFGHKASISLLSFNQNTGKMTLLDTQEWEGILPEGITFDADSDMLAVTSFDYLDLTKRQGGVHFWQIENQKLKNTGFKVSVQRGCHFVKIVQ
jgi:DNA-binding beta-propeller fold protein YncE